MRKPSILCAAAVLTASCLTAQAAPIIIDISTTTSPGNRSAVTVLDGSTSVAWNEIANGSTSTPSRNTIANLVDTAGVQTGIAINVITQGGVGSGGRVNTTNFAGTPAASLFSAAMLGNALSKLTSSAATVYELSNLDPSKAYNFDFVSSLTPPTDAATAGTSSFTLLGATSTVSSISAANNTALLTMSDIAPSATGTIRITWAITGSVSYAPLNVFQVDEVSIPEPASLSLLGLAAGTLLLRRRS